MNKIIISLLQLMVLGLVGLSGPHVLSPVMMAHRSRIGSAPIQSLSMVGNLALESLIAMCIAVSMISVLVSTRGVFHKANLNAFHTAGECR